METIEIIILVGFATMAAYLMWIHYHLLHRDYTNDIYYAINSSIKPALDGLDKLFSGIAQDSTALSDAVYREVQSQRVFLEEQKRLLNEQTNTMKEFKIAIDGIIESMKIENAALKKDLIAKQEILDRLKKKAGG